MVPPQCARLYRCGPGFVEPCSCRAVLMLSRAHVEPRSYGATAVCTRYRCGPGSGGAVLTLSRARGSRAQAEPSSYGATAVCTIVPLRPGLGRSRAHAEPRSLEPDSGGAELTWSRAQVEPSSGGTVLRWSRAQVEPCSRHGSRRARPADGPRARVHLPLRSRIRGARRRGQMDKPTRGIGPPTQQWHRWPSQIARSPCHPR